MNKNTLWIFGDSFSTGRDLSNRNVWTNLLAEKLDADLAITAKGGSSLGWMMYQSLLNRNSYKENDYIIFQTTTPERAFLSKNKPGLAEYWKDCPDWNSLNDLEKTGYQFHIDNIHDKEVLLLQFQSWLWGISHYTNHLKTKPILIRAWDIGNFDIPENIKLADGILLDISMAEFSGPFNDSIDWMLDNAGDPRHNHFSTINHHRITEILYNAFTEEKFTPDFNSLHKKIYVEYPKVGDESWSRNWIV